MKYNFFMNVCSLLFVLCLCSFSSNAKLKGSSIQRSSLIEIEEKILLLEPKDSHFQMEYKAFPIIYILLGVFLSISWLVLMIAFQNKDEIVHELYVASCDISKSFRDVMKNKTKGDDTLHFFIDKCTDTKLGKTDF